MVSDSRKYDPPSGVHSVGDAAFAGDDLLGAQRQGGGGLGGKRPSLIERVGVQRLRAAENGSERLKGRAYDVVVRLLRGQGTAGGLRVETQRPGTRLPGAKAIAHDPVPDAARGAVFGHLFEEIVVRVEEKRKARREIIDCQAAPDRSFHILDAVLQREREFLNRRGAGLADVVAADGDGIELGGVPGGKLEGVYHQAQRRFRRVDILLLRDILF